MTRPDIEDPPRKSARTARDPALGHIDGAASPGTRIRILDAAETLFAADGFDATPTSRIAQAAGVPKGLLFYYFPTKLDILTTLVDERLDAAIADPAALTAPGNPARALLNIADRLHVLRSESSTLSTIIWREQHTHPQVHAALLAHRQVLHQTIMHVLAASLNRPIAESRLKAAAAAWAATITAHPIGTPEAAKKVLAAVARLIQQGLQAATA